MEKATVVVQALAAGAAASLRPNVMDTTDRQTPVQEAFLQLKELLEEHYRGKSVQIDLLDIAPASIERQETVRRELKAVNRPVPDDVIDQAYALLQICAEEQPEALTAVGLDPLVAVRPPTFD